MTVEEYARAIAETVRDWCGSVADGGEGVGPRIQGLDLGAIIASVPVPDAQALRGQIESEVWEARKRIEAALHAEIAELRAQIVDVVFDGPPGPEGGRFVECEDADGVSINAGNWWQREDGYWALRIVRPPTRTVQAQNRDHDAEMFRRGWMAGQADALKQIDAARATAQEQLASREKSAASLAAFAADPGNADLYAAPMTTPDWETRDLLRTYWREHVKDQKQLIYLARVATGADTHGVTELDRRGMEIRDALLRGYEQNEDLCFLDEVRRENERLKADIDAARSDEREAIIDAIEKRKRGGLGGCTEGDLEFNSGLATAIAEINYRARSGARGV